MAQNSQWGQSTAGLHAPKRCYVLTAAKANRFVPPASYSSIHDSGIAATAYEGGLLTAASLLWPTWQ